MVVASKANWGDSSNPWGCILPRGSATWRHVSVFFNALEMNLGSEGGCVGRHRDRTIFYSSPDHSLRLVLSSE